MYELIIYFIIGAILDILATLDTQAVIDIKPIKSSAISFTITILWVFALSSIVLSSEKAFATLAYALGGAIGSYFTVQRKRSTS